MEGAEWKDDLQGTPQGAVVSPSLANVYLHYVLDLWFQNWRARNATGGHSHHRTLIDRWGRLRRAWGFKWTPTALVGSIAHRQAA